MLIILRIFFSTYRNKLVDNTVPTIPLKMIKVFIEKIYHKSYCVMLKNYLLFVNDLSGMFVTSLY